jgi:phenylacetate-CoA ligase
MMVWNKEETNSRSEMQVLQIARLQETVSYIYEKNPQYRKKLEELSVQPSDIRSLDDIRRLPFTTKQDIRENYPFKLFTAPQQEIVEYHATSGTTGKPVVVGYTRQDLESWKEVMARAFTAAGITNRDVVQNIYGYGLFTGGLGAHYGAIRVGAAVIPISGGNTQRQLMLMEDFGSTVLTSTPSFLMHLYEAGEEQGINFHKLNLRVGVLGAEPWSESKRLRPVTSTDSPKSSVPGLPSNVWNGNKGCTSTKTIFIPRSLIRKRAKSSPRENWASLFLPRLPTRGSLFYASEPVTSPVSNTAHVFAVGIWL